MYMAGRVTKHIKIREANDQNYQDTKRKEMMNIINSEDRFSEEKGQLFIASVKDHIDKNHINEHINFSVIWKKRTYKTDEKTVDYCHFIIDDVEEIVLFSKHTAFKSLVVVMAEKRQQAMKEGVINKMIVIDSDISKGQSYQCAPQMMNVDASSYRYV
ncbi:MAG: hypothetical protein EZS28_007963 [Streblomastix strix]|uniref:Uncharacterized protein n=1 Tax=Streblomastix strix TaxID=222440 RepID=A0A5J4WPH8_9EUKA|nr:MAG: hypothetical protein EZS28_007963 [Streblomastix strix]